MITEKMKMGMKKALAMVLTVSMSTALFYVPGSPIEKTKEAEAQAAGTSRTFNNTSTGYWYSNTNKSTGTLGSTITMNAGIYHWTVPETGIYQIQTIGAKGGNGNGGSIGGNGTSMKGDFLLIKNSVLKILVGQMGLMGSTDGVSGGGGGGGSFVTTNTNSPLIISGGGGGGEYRTSRGIDASTGNNGVNGMNGATTEAIGTGGIGGAGGTAPYLSGGGVD